MTYLYTTLIVRLYIPLSKSSESEVRTSWESIITVVDPYTSL